MHFERSSFGFIDYGIPYCVTFGTELFDFFVLQFPHDDINVIIGQKVVVMNWEIIVNLNYFTMHAWYIINFINVCLHFYLETYYQFFFYLLYLFNGKVM